MKWPIYVPPTGVQKPAEVAAYEAQARGAPRQGPQGHYGVAVDVWRDGALLWRSYDLAQAEAVDDWTYRAFFAQYGTDYPRDYDSGPWGAPGVNLGANDVIPTLDAVRWFGGARDVANLIRAMLAIGQLPHSPTGLDTAPTYNAILLSFSRAREPWQTFTAHADGVTVRILAAKVQPPGADADDHVSDGGTWHAEIVHRKTRNRTATAATLEERAIEFEADPHAPASTLIRRAKKELGVAGWHATRVGDTLEWRLTGAPYSVVISPLTAEEGGSTLDA